MRLRRASWPVPLIPGWLTYRKTRQGRRLGIGPRWLRLHAGSGPVTVSSSFLWHTWTWYPRKRGNNSKRSGVTRLRALGSAPARTREDKMRDIMTAAELAAHKTGEHGRDYTFSDDGYGDMEAAGREGWRAIPGWGRGGWDLGDWPYVVIYAREDSGTFELMQIVEGDHALYTFSSEDDRTAAIDYLFLWYAADQSWAPLTWEQRADLDAGNLQVAGKFRGPYRRTEVA